MNLFGLSGLLIGITSSTIGIFVFLKNPRSAISRLWALFNLTAAIWGFGAYKITLTKDAASALFWWRATHMGVIFIPVLFLHLVYVFLQKDKKWPVVLTYLFGIVFAALNLTGLLIKNVEWVFDSFYYDGRPPTDWYVIFTILWFFATLFSHYELYRGFKKSAGIRSNQIRYFFFATAVGYTGGITCFLPVFGMNIYPYANFTVVLYPLIMTYAIFKFRLMDIKVTITRTGVFAAVYTIVLGLPLAFMTAGKPWLIRLLGDNWWNVPLALLIFLSAAGPFVYIRLQRRAESILLRRQHHYHATLREVTRGISRIRNLKKLLDLIIKILTEAVGISHSAVYLLDEKSGQFALKAEHNFKKGQPLIDKSSALTGWFEGQKEPLVYEEIKQTAAERPSRAFEELERQMRLLNSAVIIPSFLEDKLLAILILGDKGDDEIYSTEDLAIFSVLASQAALAIENASLYENMEGQIKQRTEELVRTQKQLIQAEKLATVGTLAGGVAHEINNPLAAILTNAQMMLASAENAEDKESLLLMEEAAKRCRDIVKKLMTYSRKPLGDRKITDVDLEKALDNVVSLLRYQLAQENIKVNTYTQSGPFIINGSQNEMEQVFTNLILNAKDAIRKVKKTGTIDISMSKDKGKILVKIKDDGAGIPQERLTKIFDPFFTTKDVGQGTGLGLSICQSIIEQHKGTIEASSFPGEGALFVITLPAKA